MVTQSATNSLTHDPLLGKMVGGRYLIQRLIGRGGVGLVYLAFDTEQDDREVVVKVLAPHWAEDRDAVVRFDREAKRMAELDHVNVVKMFDHGHFEGRTYIVMEFIRGEPLRRYLNRRKRLPLEEFIPIASQILLGVGYVHERGIMLRDIKPPNIMLCEHEGKANHVKMLDFGLARLIEEDEEDEVTKAHVIGTAAYMSPEQIKGEAIDVRVDVYALGVLFFLMLTGETPISGDNDAAVLVNHVHGKPKKLLERLPRNHRIPPKLVELIESCLAKDADDRPADAMAMAEALFELIPGPLFEQPDATAKTRVAADTYWAARMSSGAANIAALESDTSDSAEWTRPLLRKAARTGEAPLKLAEEEMAAHKAQAQVVPRRRRATTGSGLRPRPGSGAQRMPPPPPPPPGPGARPRPRSGSGASPLPRPKPGSGASPLPRPKPGSGARPMPRPGSIGAPLPAVPKPGSGAQPLPTPGSGAHAIPDPDAGDQLRPRSRTGSTKSGNRPGANTVRVTAADAKEAVERLEQELDQRNTAKRTTIPPGLDAERSDDGLLISFEDEDEDELVAVLEPHEDTGPGVGSVESASPTMPLGADPLGHPATYVGVPPASRDNGMKLGVIVAVAGLAALALGGLSAYLILGGEEETAAPTASVTPEAPKTGRGPEVGSVAPSDRGTVEVRAVEGARVEVDGEDRGEAPVQLELLLGEHRVRVTAEGYHPWQTTIDVRPGDNAAVKAELEALEPGAPPEPQPEARPEPSPEPARKRPSGKRPKSKPSSSPTTKDEPAPEPKPKSKPKSDVFLDDSKPGKDDGIFLPVGGK